MRFMTEQKNVQMPQLFAQDLTQIILDGATNMIIAVDVSGLVTVFNKAAEQSLGYTAQEVIGKHTPLLWHDAHEVEQRAHELSADCGENIEPGFRVFTEIPNRAGKEEREWTFITHAGKRYPVHLTIRALHSENQAVVGYIGIIRDISKEKESDAERQIVEEKLRYSEQVFRSAIENASIGMALVSPAGQWLLVNNALCHLLGYERKEMLNLDFQSITHADDLPPDIENVQKILRGQIQSYSMEKRYYRKDGHIIWALLSVSLVRRRDGAPDYFISQIQDITERKEMDKLKGDFVSVVSHELRTPLTSIRGSLALIAGAMSKDLPDKVRHLIDIAHKNSERLILLINDILDIDKIAAGQMRFDIEREFLKSLVEQAVEANRPYAEKLDVHIEVESIYPPITIDVDSARFMQVLSNLLSNAAKFSPKGETVHVFLAMVDGKIRVCVKDKGPGIAEEFHGRIFRKFSQADSSATRAKGGTGLGLYITKEIVECMGGKIGFETEVGKGTVFWVEFANTSYPIQPRADAAPTGREAYRVLIYDHDENIIDRVKAKIEQGGFTADTALNLVEARKKLKNHTYAAMTMNLAQSQSYGIDFIHELRSNSHTVNLPIIATSAKCGRGDNDLLGDAFGLVDWLEKPLQEEALIQALTFLSLSGHTAPWILHVGDDATVRQALGSARPSQSTLINVSTLNQANRHLKQRRISLVILDMDMAGGHGLSFIPSITDRDGTPIPVIVLSSVGNNKNSIEIMPQSPMAETKIAETILSLILRYQGDPLI